MVSDPFARYKGRVLVVFTPCQPKLEDSSSAQESLWLSVLLRDLQLAAMSNAHSPITSGAFAYHVITDPL